VLGGPTYASTLAEAANSVFILDALYAYEPQRLGVLLAMIRFSLNETDW